MSSEIKPKRESLSSLTHHQEDLFERLAFGASLVCLVHCLALPVLLAMLPTLARTINLPESLHVWILVFAIPTSLAALIAGRSRHASTWPLALGFTGLGFLALGALAFEETNVETVLTVIGSITLIAAHGGNWRLRHIGHAHR